MANELLEAKKVCEELGEHDWDVMDMTDSTGGEAYEYCARCGKKSGK